MDTKATSVEAKCNKKCHKKHARECQKKHVTRRRFTHGMTLELELELELELIQTQMTQKPMLRAEVYAHAMRASQNCKKEVRREKEV